MASAQAGVSDGLLSRECASSMAVAWRSTNPKHLSSLGEAPGALPAGTEAMVLLSVLHFGTRKEVIRVSSLYL